MQPMRPPPRPLPPALPPPEPSEEPQPGRVDSPLPERPVERIPPILNEPKIAAELSAALVRERKLESLVDELRKPEPRKRRSIVDSLKPKSPAGVAGIAAGIAAVMTALGMGISAIITSVGGGAGLAQVFHAPELRGQIAALRSENEALTERVTELEAREKTRAAAESKRWEFVGAALCRGALVTAKGVDCDAVTWEPRPIPKRNQPPAPWRATGDHWPRLPDQ